MTGEYHRHAIEMRDLLAVESPSLCLAKWQQVSIHLPQGLTQSCYHPPTHPIPVELLDENPGVLHNTPQKKAERKMMKEGERPPGCSYCWKIEDAPSTTFGTASDFSNSIMCWGETVPGTGTRRFSRVIDKIPWKNAIFHRFA